MTQHRDIDRVLDAWLAEGPREVPTRVFDDTVDRLRRERQRGSWRLPWRSPQMSMPIRIAAVAAAIAAIIFVGVQALNLTSDVGPPPSPTPTSLTSPAPSPGPEACVGGDCAGVLSAGRHRANAPLVPFAYAVTDGWRNIFNNIGGYVLRRLDGEPPGHGFYVFYDLQAANQAECQQAPAEGVGTSAADLAAWFDTVPGIDKSNVFPVTVGGLSGEAFDLTVSGARLKCDGESKLLVQDWSGDPSFWWGVGDAERQHVIVLDRGSGGTVVLIVAAPDAEFAPFADLVSPILGTIDFDEQCATDDSTCTGALARGTHTSGALVVPFSYTVPARWSKPLDVPGSVNLQAANFGGTMLGILPDWAIADQDTCTSDPEPGAGRTVADLVTFLVDHPGLITTAPAPASIGGLDGQVLDVQVDSAYEGPCLGEVNLFTHVGTIDDVGWWTVRDIVRARYWFLDAGGGRTVAVMLETIEPDEWEAYLAVAVPVVESLDFTP